MQSIQKEWLKMPKNKEKELQDIYNKIFEQSIKHMKKYEPQMVAGKTSLSNDGFSQMLQTILDSESDIRPYGEEDGEGTIH